MRALGTSAALIGSLLVTGVFARPVLAATLTTGTVTEFPLPATPLATSGPQNIVVGPDGNIWFTIQNSDQIGRITPASPNTISVFPVPTAASQPNGIAVGPDGNIWFTEFNAGKIGEINPSLAVNGSSAGITEYTLPAGSGSGPRNITAGPSGTMWFTEYNANKIGSITISAAVAGTSDGVNEYSVAAGSNPRGIVEGPDGNIWFTEYTADYVGYLNPASPSTPPVLFPVDTPTAGSGPRSIDVGPGGYLWFTENNAAKVGKILVASPNTITEYPTLTSASVPARMTEGPDGNMWFSENGVNQIGSITPGGVITEYGITTLHSNPVGVITGPDHNIWFTENGTDKIGQLAVVLPTTTTLGSSSNPSDSGTSITLTATVSIQAVAGTVPLATPATGTVTFFDGPTNLGTVTLSAGTATLPISTLGVGSDGLTAVYNGDNFNTTSTSNTFTQVVQAVSAIGLVTSGSPTTVGDPVTFTATVTPSSATGTVTFLDGAGILGTGTLNGGGVATLNTSALAPGTYSITASYPGDTYDTGITSTAVSQVVNQILTTTGVATGPNPSQNGQSVAFTATVTPGTATGTVTFFDGSTNLGSSPLSSGTATLNSSALGVGTHDDITATYNGDTNDAGSTSSAATPSQVVNPGNTSTVLGSNENPSTFGDLVTFTATVSPDTATGTVIFSDGGTSLGSGTLISGSTTLTTALLSGGDHNISAVYGGDSNDDGSTSNLVVQVVNPIATTVGLETSGSPSTFGDPVTFTATALPDTATGIVTFLDGSTVIGSDALSSGTATLDISTLGGGDHDITASYVGDTNDAGNVSPTVLQHVNPAGTSTGVASGTNPSSNGESVTFTATVAPTTATGSVNFLDGATIIGSGTLGAGTATFSTSLLSVGSHTITAVYGGDTNDAGSTSPTAVTQVVQAISGTALGSLVNPSQFGQSVLLTATVTPPSATGSVTFFDGSASIGSGTLSAGTATLATTTLAVTSHSITAVYAGDAGDTGSSSTVLTQVVNQDTTGTVVTSPLNPSQTGQSVTFTATVTPAAASGTVTFMDGAASLATERVTAGVATFPTTTLALGSHSITAVYSGDTNDLSSTSPILTQVVNNSSTGTTTTLTSSANPAKFGAKLTFTAKVTPSGATGKVTFKDGTTTLGTATLKKGVATFSTTKLALGTHQITAVYAGSKKFPGSTSAKLAEKVTKTGKAVAGPVQAPLTSSEGSVSIDLIGRRIDSGSY